jgi:hypothetical protein
MLTLPPPDRTWTTPADLRPDEARWAIWTAASPWRAAGPGEERRELKMIGWVRGPIHRADPGTPSRGG